MIFIFSPNHVWPEQVPFEVKIPSINDDDDDRAGELNNFANTNSDNEKNPKPVNWRRWMLENWEEFFSETFFLNCNHYRMYNSFARSNFKKILSSFKSILPRSKLF